MMFSLSPGANKSHPHAEATDKNTCVSTTTQPLTSTPTQPPTLQAHRVTPSQPPTSQPHKVTSTQPSMSQPHKVTSTQPPTSQPHRVTSSQPPISQTHRVTSTQSPTSQPHRVTSSQPPISQTHGVTSTQPSMSQPHKVTSTQPPTSQPHRVTSTQPPTSQPHKVTSTQPPTAQPPTSQPQDSAVRARPHTSHNAPPDNQVHVGTLYIMRVYFCIFVHTQSTPYIITPNGNLMTLVVRFWGLLIPAVLEIYYNVCFNYTCITSGGVLPPPLTHTYTAEVTH